MKWFIPFMLFFLSTNLCASSQVYKFSRPEYQQRFEYLTGELRCLVCQNQNIAESNAPLAQDLRKIILEKLESGQGDQDIIHYLVQRYGDFILYKPPFNIKTALLWLGPLLIFCSAIVVLFFSLRRRTSELC